MQLDKIKEIVESLIEGTGIILYSMKLKKEFGESILEILLDKKGITVDELEVIHLKLQEQLTDDIFNPNYYLELASVGAERPIRNEDEMMQAVGDYIYVESPKYKGNADLISFESGQLTLQINEKGRIRKIQIHYGDLTFARLAIRF